MRSGDAEKRAAKPEPNRKDSGGTATDTDEVRQARTARNEHVGIEEGSLFEKVLETYPREAFEQKVQLENEQDRLFLNLVKVRFENGNPKDNGRRNNCHGNTADNHHRDKAAGNGIVDWYS